MEYMCKFELNIELKLEGVNFSVVSHCWYMEGRPSWFLCLLKVQFFPFFIPLEHRRFATFRIETIYGVQSEVMEMYVLWRMKNRNQTKIIKFQLLN